MASLRDKIEKALGSPIIGSRPMRGGDIADVSCLTLKDGRRMVAKRPRADQPDTTATEAMMLAYLANASNLPVPAVTFHASGILVMEHIEHKGTTDPLRAAENVAQHVAALHGVLRQNAKPYGFEKDTVIGPLPQENRPNASWVDFFRDHRMLAMARSCVNTSRMDSHLMARLEAFAARLPDLIPSKPTASLLHGDLWAGNMLINGDTAAAFIDPAISYGDREVDLAFIALMGGLDHSFFDTYTSIAPLDPGFHESRCAIYQLWPLLVHVRLFGGGYTSQVTRILDRFGA